MDELEKVAILYDSIRDLHKRRNPEKDQELARDFDHHLQRVMKNLYQSIRNSNVPENIKKVNGLKAKYDLYDICLTKLSQLMEEDELEQSPILKDIHSGVHNIISGFYDHFMIEESNHITLGAGRSLGDSSRLQIDNDSQQKIGKYI